MVNPNRLCEILSVAFILSGIYFGLIYKDNRPTVSEALRSLSSCEYSIRFLPSAYNGNDAYNVNKGRIDANVVVDGTRVDAVYLDTPLGPDAPISVDLLIADCGKGIDSAIRR